MSIATVVLGGFGSDNLIATLGFGGGEELHGVVVRRGRMRLWQEDEIALPEREILEATEAQLAGRVERQEYIEAELRGQLARAERTKLRRELTGLNAQILRLKHQVAAQEHDYRQALSRAKAETARLAEIRRLELEEEEDVQAIVSFITQLYDD